MKVQILDRCEFCDGEAYVYECRDVDARGEPYDRYRPCEMCKDLFKDLFSSAKIKTIKLTFSISLNTKTPQITLAIIEHMCYNIVPRGSLCLGINRLNEILRITDSRRNFFIFFILKTPSGVCNSPLFFRDFRGFDIDPLNSITMDHSFDIRRYRNSQFNIGRFHLHQ